MQIVGREPAPGWCRAGREAQGDLQAEATGSRVPTQGEGRAAPAPHALTSTRECVARILYKIRVLKMKCALCRRPRQASNEGGAELAASSKVRPSARGFPPASLESNAVSWLASLPWRWKKMKCETSAAVAHDHHEVPCTKGPAPAAFPVGGASRIPQVASILEGDDHTSFTATQAADCESA